MRLPRIRITIWRMMIVVLVVGLACGWPARQLRRKSLLAAARAQGVLTKRTVSRRFFLRPGTAHANIRLGYVDLLPDRVRWVLTYKASHDYDKTWRAHVEVYGDSDGTPISITDYGGAWNAKVIKALTRNYRQRGWKYVIISRAGDY
jgi:hypothetical protein